MDTPAELEKSIIYDHTCNFSFLKEYLSNKW